MCAVSRLALWICEPQKSGICGQQPSHLANVSSLRQMRFCVRFAGSSTKTGSGRVGVVRFFGLQRTPCRSWSAQQKSRKTRQRPQHRGCVRASNGKEGKTEPQLGGSAETSKRAPRIVGGIVESAPKNVSARTGSRRNRCVSAKEENMREFWRESLLAHLEPDVEEENDGRILCGQPQRKS